MGNAEVNGVAPVVDEVIGEENVVEEVVEEPECEPKLVVFRKIVCYEKDIYPQCYQQFEHLYVDIFKKNNAAAKGILLLFKNTLRDIIGEDDLEDYLPFLPSKEVAYDSDGKFSRNQVVDILIPQNSCKPLKNGVWELMDSLLQCYSDDRYLLRGFDMWDSDEHHLIKYLENIELMMELLPTWQLVQAIGNARDLLNVALKTKLPVRSSDQVVDEFQIVSDILVCLPYSGSSDWYWRVLNNMCNHSIGLVIVDEIHPTFIEDYELNEELKRLSVPEEEEPEIEEELKEAMTIRPPTDKVDTELGKSVEALELRFYQQELAAHALKGHNSIVCAVTGAGKTEVGIRIIKQVLDTHQTNKKIAMLVPTCVLVDQQEKRMRKYLRDKWRIMGLRSATDPVIKNIQRLMYQADVVVMTPQILVNMLNKECDPPIDLTTFSLLVFDECHHCESKHPYKEIMDMYLDMKHHKDNQGKSVKDLGLPQILGLTASLGGGKMRNGKKFKTLSNVAEAIQSIELRAAYFDASYVSSVMTPEGKQNLSDKVTIATDRLINVQKTRTEDSRDILQIVLFMVKCEKWIKDAFAEWKNKGGKICAEDKIYPDKLMMKYRGGQKYLSWVNNLVRIVKELPGEGFEDNRSNLLAYLSYLIVCCDGLFLYSHVSLEQTVRFLASELEKRTPDAQLRMHHEGFAPVDAEVLQNFKDAVEKVSDVVKQWDSQMHGDRVEDNKLLNELVKRLEQMKNSMNSGGDDNIDARAIVFVERRVLAYYLKEYLDKEFGLPVEWVARPQTQNSDDRNKLNITKDIIDKNIKDFNDGTLRVLVATDILGEGLDVKECSLIIKYNYVTNVRKFIQHRGRARAKGGESVLICAEGWIAQREQENMRNEQFLEDAVQYIATKIGPEGMVFKNNVKQLLEYQGREVERNRKKEKAMDLTGKVYDICCSQCGQFVVSSEFMRILCHHYVIVDTKIWDRVHVNAQKASIVKRSIYAGIKVGLLLCRGNEREVAGCMFPLGKVLLIDGTWFPVLKASNVTLKNKYQQDYQHTDKKWSRIGEIYFPITAIIGQEQFQMSCAIIRRTQPMNMLCDGEDGVPDKHIKQLSGAEVVQQFNATTSRTLYEQDAHERKRMDAQREIKEHSNKYLDGEAVEWSNLEWNNHEEFSASPAPSTVGEEEIDDD